MLLEHLDDYELPALIYSVATMVCLVFDLISFFVFVGIAGNLKRSANNILATVEGDQIPSSYEMEQQRSLISLF